MILQKATSKDVQTEVLPFALGLLIIGRSTPEGNLEMAQQSDIFDSFWQTIRNLGIASESLSDKTLDILRTLVTHLAIGQRKEVL